MVKKDYYICVPKERKDLGLFFFFLFYSWHDCKASRVPSIDLLLVQIARDPFCLSVRLGS